jgi:hypothetical protein
MRVCRHCKVEHSSRVGRGLCRTCWDNKDIKALYAPLAPFGGREAGLVWDELKRERAKSKPLSRLPKRYHINGESWWGWLGSDRFHKHRHILEVKVFEALEGGRLDGNVRAYESKDRALESLGEALKSVNETKENYNAKSQKVAK